MTYNFRTATPEDAAALLEIYGPYVRDTAITFEYEIPSEEEFARRIRTTLERYPYIVAEREGTILGYSYAGPFRTRKAYSWAAEVTVYVGQQFRGEGIGSSLYEKLIETLKAMNITNVEACITCTDKEDETLTNASPRFHEAVGFQKVGRFYNCGYKFGRWYDMVYMEKIINKHEVPMPPVLPFAEVRESTGL